MPVCKGLLRATGMSHRERRQLEALLAAMREFIADPVHTARND